MVTTERRQIFLSCVGDTHFYLLPTMDNIGDKSARAA
jgi:hypothetical protein